MKLLRVAADYPAPPLRWWGRIFIRVWRDREQIVLTLRLPWWRSAHCMDCDDVKICQRVVSWRQGEGWRAGWR